MVTQYMPITNEAEWLEKRKKYVTSTQLASLFGLQPASHSTMFERYLITRGQVEEAKIENNFTMFGKFAEEAVCRMATAEHPDWRFMHFPFFAFDDQDRIGSSFDYALIINNEKRYLAEIKTISYAEYKKHFIEHAPDDIEAPAHYECQMQGELEMVQDVPESMGGKFDGIVLIVCILDTRQVRYIFRTRDAEMCDGLRQAVRQFWALTEAPEPDYTLDKSLIAKIAPLADPKLTMDATQNSRFMELCAMHENSSRIIKQETKVKDAASAELMVLIGAAKTAFTDDFKVSASDVKPVAPKLITQEMVGTETGGRAGYKRLTIKSLNATDTEED